MTGPTEEPAGQARAPRRRRTAWVALGAALTLAAGVLVADLSGRFDGARAGGQQVGAWLEVEDAWPEDAVRLTPLAGAEPGLELGDGPVLVNLWATTCAPCVAEMPVLQEVAETSGVRVVDISRDTVPAQAEAFLRERGVDYENYLDSRSVVPAELAEVAPPQALPVSFVVVDGTVRRVHLGAFDEAADVVAVLESVR